MKIWVQNVQEYGGGGRGKNMQEKGKASRKALNRTSLTYLKKKKESSIP